MAKSINLILLAKSIDGGTGTNFLALSQLKKSYPQGSLRMRNLVLEKPKFRSVKFESIHFFAAINSYPSYYTLGLKNIQIFVQELQWLKKHCKDSPPDIILSIDMHCNILSLLLKIFFLKKIKVIATTHIFLSTTLKEKSSLILFGILKIITHFLYCKADALIAVSEGVTDDLQRTFSIKKPITTIYYGVQQQQTAHIRHILPSKKLKIITVSRLVKQKDIKTLIKAFDLLHKKYKATQLTIVGDGPMKNEIQKFIEQLKLLKSVKMEGWSNSTNRFFRTSHIFVLSTFREGLPYTLLEAMSYGLPVIATDIPAGPYEILQNNRYGMLVPVCNEVALMNALEQLLTNPKEYNKYSNEALKRSKYFSESKMLQGYKKIIDQLAST